MAGFCYVQQCTGYIQTSSCTHQVTRPPTLIPLNLSLADLGENIARSLESDMAIAHGIAADNTTQGLMADLQLYGRTLVTPHYSVLPLQVDNPEVRCRVQREPCVMRTTAGGRQNH